MDPISVAASILGLLGAAAKVSEVLANFIKAVKDAPKLARRVFSEVEDLTLCFERIQEFVNSEATVNSSRAAMITVDQLLIVLTNCVTTFSELENALGGLTPKSFSVNIRLRWITKEHNISKLLQRLLSSKASLNLILTTLNCTRMQEAQEAIQSLANIVSDVLSNNQDVGRRLGDMDLPTTLRHRSAPSALEGTSHAGKSTVLKQLQMMRGTKFTQTEIGEARNVLYFNLLTVFNNILQYHPTLSAMAQDLSDELARRCGIIQQLVGKSIMQNLSKIFVRESSQSFLACLYAHIETIGVYKCTLDLGPFDLEICDVGGARAVRKKLIHCMKDLDYAIYVADLNGYCQNLQEDLDANQMWESLQLFESLLKMPELADTTVFLFLNKADLFETTILREPISDYFPDYTGGADYWKGTQYFANKFAALDHRLDPSRGHDFIAILCAWRIGDKRKDCGRTGAYYNFTNIRYAAPPLGQLRFLPPQPPLPSPPDTILDGTTEGNICPQAAPSSWDWTNANIPNGQVIPIGNSTLPESEDCLFLDVVVPVGVFKRRGKGTGAPVLVNIHGGGFFIGDKATLYPPQGLLAASNNTIIYVSMNYRVRLLPSPLPFTFSTIPSSNSPKRPPQQPNPTQLTAFGFLSNLPPSPPNTTSPNAGLLDQRLALLWIQNHIHLFGGSPSRVTLLGESGGGASLMFHAIAYGASRGPENKLFHQVIAQSPGPIVGNAASQRRAAEAFLSNAGAASVAEARTLPSERLVQANRRTEAAMPFFGPSVDGELVPDLPSRLFTQGRYVKGLRVMAAHNSDEARLFIPPTRDSEAAFEEFLATRFPRATEAQIRFINRTLYPPPPWHSSFSHPSIPYTTQYGRLKQLDADIYNICWTVLLASTTAVRAYNYIFSVPPGYHAQDLAYTFYNGEAFQKDVNVQVAKVLQRAIANFVGGGDPNGGEAGGEVGGEVGAEGGGKGGGEGRFFPVWGPGAQVANLTEMGVRGGVEEAVGR
ncbi:MAG: hypothetical protein Q9202_004465, partial [Teloschistes flavicans]